jgi:hypothetical protein
MEVIKGVYRCLFFLNLGCPFPCTTTQRILHATGSTSSDRSRSLSSATPNCCKALFTN